jgi:hypothetical protein
MQPDEHKLLREQERGRRAEEALQNEILQETFDALRKNYLTAWTVTDVADSEGRENLWRCIQILTDVENHIRTVARNGRIARTELEQIARKFKPKVVRR